MATARRTARAASLASTAARHLPTTGVYADMESEIAAMNEELDDFVASSRVTMSQVDAAIEKALENVDERIRAIVVELDLVTRTEVVQMIEEYMATHEGLTASQVQEMIDTAVGDALNTAY